MQAGLWTYSPSMLLPGSRWRSHDTFSCPTEGDQMLHVPEWAEEWSWSLAGSPRRSTCCGLKGCQGECVSQAKPGTFSIPW